MAQTTHEVIREAVDALVRQQAQHLYVRGALSAADRLYPPKPGTKAPVSGFELVLGKMEADAIVATMLKAEPPKQYGVYVEAGARPGDRDTKLSVLTHLGYPVIVEGETGAKVRVKTELVPVRYRGFGRSDFSRLHEQSWRD